MYGIKNYRDRDALARHRQPLSDAIHSPVLAAPGMPQDNEGGHARR